MSLRARLTLLTGVSLGVAFAVVAVLVYVVVAHGLDQRTDDLLRSQARSVLSVVGPAATGARSAGGPLRQALGSGAARRAGLTPPQAAGAGNGAAGEVPAAGLPTRIARRQLIAQVVDAQGAVLARSQPLLALGGDLPADASTLALSGSAGQRFHSASVGGEHVRILDVGTRTGPVVQLAVPDTDVREALQRLRRTLVFGGLLAAGIAALLGWRLAGEALRPIARVVHAARRIAHTRDATQRVPEPHQHDEVGELAVTVNEMLAALDEAQQAQQRFVADASHELRTPLTSMQGNLDFLARPDLQPEARSEALADLRGAVTQLASLTTDLLALARADAGFVEQRSPVDISSLVEQACAPASADHPISMQVQPGVHVLGNRVALDRALGNLLENARRYTPVGTPIEVSLTATNGTVQVRVRDHGPGLAPEDAARAFDRFHRAATSSGTDGSGLGLAIVRQTLRAHGGEVALRTAPGAGCAFDLTLPAA